MKIDEIKNIDITKVNRDDLVDIRTVNIDANLKQEQKMREFIEQIKNPYCYTYGDYIVKISFEDTEVTLAERLSELILKAASTM